MEEKERLEDEKGGGNGDGGSNLLHMQPDPRCLAIESIRDIVNQAVGWILALGQEQDGKPDDVLGLARRELDFAEAMAERHPENDRDVTRYSTALRRYVALCNERQTEQEQHA